MRRGAAILKELDRWENEIVNGLEGNPTFEEFLDGLFIDGLSRGDAEIVRINALLRLRTLHAQTY